MKLKIKCHCCPAIIEITPPPQFADTELYETVIKRGNILCDACFRRLSRHR